MCLIETQTRSELNQWDHSLYSDFNQDHATSCKVKFLDFRWRIYECKSAPPPLCYPF